MDRRERTALLGALADIFLVLWKLLLARASGSLALLADSAHSASDIVVSLSVFLGLRMQRRVQAWRMVLENVVALLVGCAILGTSAALVREALTGETSPVGLLAVALGGTLVSIAVSYFVSRFKIHVGRESESPSLVADGLHNRADMLSSVAVAIGLLGSAVGLPLDRPAAVLVGVLVGLMGLRIMRHSIQGLRQGRGLATALHGRRIHSLGEEGGIGRAATLLEQLTKLSGLIGELHRRHGRRIAIGSITILAAAYGVSGFTTIGLGEGGVVLRFGRALEGNLEPGLHLLWPWPVDRVRRVRTDEIRRVEVGFRLRTDRQAGLLEPEALMWEATHLGTQYIKLPEEAILLTGDEYLVDCSTCLQFSVSDPEAYLLGSDSPDEIIRAITEEALREMASRVLMNDLLVARRTDLETRLLGDLTTALSRYDLGVTLHRLLLLDVHPPVEVVEAYRDVSSAREDRVRLINDAEAYRNQSLHQARGQQAELLARGQALREESILRAKGGSKRFDSLWDAVADAGELALWRLQLETLEKSLAGAEIFLVPTSQDTGALDLRFYDGLPKAME